MLRFRITRLFFKKKSKIISIEKKNIYHKNRVKIGFLQVKTKYINKLIIHSIKKTHISLLENNINHISRPHLTV